MQKFTALLTLAAFMSLTLAAHAEDAKPAPAARKKVKRPREPILPGFTTHAFGPDDTEERGTDLLADKPGRVPLHIESTGAAQPIGRLLSEDDAAVYGPREGGGHGTYQLLCETPCTLHVEPGMFSLIAGGQNSGVLSRDVQLEVPPTGLNVRMRAPSRALSITGSVLTIVGGLGLLAGAVLMPLSVALPNPSAPNTSPYLSTGGLALGIGLVLLVPGIVLLILNRGGIDATAPYSG